MSAVEPSKLPAASKAESSLRDALDRWDEQAADVAVTSMVRNFGANRVYAVLAKYAARDFRSIGHKVIYLSNAFRTLQTIGWEYAEPVMRSLVYAMLNHNGQPNPSTSDLDADRPGRHNRELVKQLPELWLEGKTDDAATVDLVQTLHQCSPNEGQRKKSVSCSAAASRCSRFGMRFLHRAGEFADATTWHRLSSCGHHDQCNLSGFSNGQ